MARYDIGGKTYTFDDNLSSDEVMDLITEITANNKPQDTKPQAKPVSDVGAMDYGRAALQGLTFGFGDEAVAGLKSLAGQDYDQALADERARLAAVREESPILSTGLEIAGAIPTALIPGAGLARLGQAGKALVSSPVGRYGLAALEGGTYGVGASDDKSASDFLGGAALGVGGAKVAGMAGNAISKGISKYKGRNDLGRDKLIEAMARDDDTPEALLARLAENRKSGDLPETIADVGGENVRNLARDIQATPSAARSEAVKTFAERNANQDERVLSGLTNALGTQQGGIKYLEDLQTARRRASKPAYNAAYRTEAGVERFVDDPQIERFLGRDDFKEAYQRAQRIFNDEQFAKPDDLEGVPFPKLFEEVEGKLVRTKAQPTVRQLDYIKRGLDDNIKSKSRTGGLGNQERASSSQILGMFRDTIDESVPQYGAARKKFGDDLDVEESYEAGKGLLKVNKSADAVRNELSQLSEPAKQAYRVGVIDEITRTLENTAKTGSRRDAVKKVFDGRQEKLKALFDTEDGYKTFEALMLREANMRNTSDFVTGNSATARIGASLEDLTRDPIDVFAMGGLRGAAVEGARGLMKRKQRRAAERVADELAEPMFSPSQTDQFLRDLTQRAKQVSRNQRRNNMFLPAAGGLANPISGLLTD